MELPVHESDFEFPSKLIDRYVNRPDSESLVTIVKEILKQEN